jgi:ketosteroid isomerase-like protein
MTDVDQPTTEGAQGSEGRNEAVLEELLAQLGAALDPYYGESDPSTYAEMYADHVMTFDPWSKGKLEGNAAKEHLLAFAGVIPISKYAILSPSVDLFGDTAVFTFNVEVTHPEEGTVVAVWNTTQIHRRADESWELVHAHWSFAVPPVEAPET